MASATEVNMAREAVGYFKSAQAQEDAIDELLRSGFDRADLSLLAAADTIEAKLGHKYRKVTELEDNAGVPRTCYVPTESVGGAEGALIAVPLYVAAVTATGAIIASGGTLAAVILGTTIAGGAGALIGAVLASLVGDHHAHHLEEQLEHGGLLLWVRTWNAEDERRAVEILKRHSGRDVHVHSLPTP